MYLDDAGLKQLHQRVNDKQSEYIAVLKPLFFPRDLHDGNILEYFASLLRVVGMEDAGWDPHAESRGLIGDMETLLSCQLSSSLFPDTSATRWRIALLLYLHVVEMDGPYEVLANLLRIQTQQGYSPYPFLKLVTKDGRKQLESKPVFVSDKIDTIAEHASKFDHPIRALFDDVYSSQLRNAVAHSDFILANEGLRCRGRPPALRSLRVAYADLLEYIASALGFARSFFYLEQSARSYWGSRRDVLPYDTRYKGLLETLVDERGCMCGFAVHWPNASVSTYRRTAAGVQMVNCAADIEAGAITFQVGMCPQNPGSFSPLVEAGSQPTYSVLFRGGGHPSWPGRSNHNGG